MFDEALAVVTFHRDWASRHVICEPSVPPLGPSTAREPTPAVVAVGVGRHGVGRDNSVYPLVRG
jgi:hypothetical protein